jgi:subtilisin family serine protease
MTITQIGQAVLYIGLSAISAIAQTAPQSATTPGMPSTDLPEHYMIGNQPADVRLDLNRLAVKFAPATRSDRFSASLADGGMDLSAVEEVGVGGWALATDGTGFSDAADLNSRVQQLLDVPGVEFVSPVMVQPNGMWVVVTPDILVRVRPEYRPDGSTILQAKSAAAQITETAFGEMAGAYKIHCDSRNGFEVLALANQMAADPKIEWAEPDMLASVTKHLTPNDPGWNSLWGLNNTGQSGGTVDIDMDCNLAWDISIGSPSIRVLVLDDGAELTHPDLNIGGGADFTGAGTGGGPGNGCDNHGTAVSGCVSALVNNGLGTVGSAPGCQVLIAKFTTSNVPCDGAGSFQYSWLVSALTWGQAQGARVSSNSNGFSYSSSVAAKYQDTYNAGMVHFASAGNDGTATVGFPGSLSMVNAISAITRYGTKASFSTYGPEVSFTAPGQTIYTTDRTGVAGYGSGNYTTVDGTSFSAPYAAGVAALILSVDPTMTQIEVENQLITSATDVGTPGVDSYFGHGLVNAFEAVAYAQFSIAANVDLGTAPMTVNFTGTTARPATTWSWTFGDGGTSTEQNPTHEYLQPGIYDVSSTIESGGAYYTKSVARMISIYADTLVIGDGIFNGTIGRVDVSVHNYVPLSLIDLPFKYTGSMNITFDSVTVEGLRSWFMTPGIRGRADNLKQAAIYVQGPLGQYLEPGDGPVMTLWFHRAGSVVGTNPISVFPYSIYGFNFEAEAGTYVPVSYSGSIRASCCQGIVGDVNGDLQYEPTISDISMLVSHLFIDGIPLDCYLEADVNQSGGVTATSSDLTVSDISILVDHLFISGVPLNDCF